MIMFPNLKCLRRFTTFRRLAKGFTVEQEMHFLNAERRTKQRKMSSLKRTALSSKLAKFDTVISTVSAGYNVISDHTILSLLEIRTQAITCRP